MHAYLGLGSDRGNRAAWLGRGTRQLRAAGLVLDAVSSLWLTEPVGDASLPWFLNCVVRLVNPPPPRQLLRACLDIEAQCDRHRALGRPEPRTLDIDLLLYDQLIVDAPDLLIPHPRMHERRFVLAPLAEIAPDTVHPRRAATVAELLRRADSAPGVWLLARFPS